MNIEFATNDPATAQRYLDNGDTDYMSDELKDAIIDAVKAGACRIRDPYMYNGSPDMVKTSDTTTEAWDHHMSIIKPLFNRDWANRKAKEQA